MAVYEVKNAQGERINLIEWDGVTPYDPGEGNSLLLLDMPSDENVSPPPDAA